MQTGGFALAVGGLRGWRCFGAEIARRDAIHGYSGTSYLICMTQDGWSNGNATKPITAVTAISSGLLTFQRNSTASDATQMRIVSQSPMAI